MLAVIPLGRFYAATGPSKYKGPPSRSSLEPRTASSRDRTSLTIRLASMDAVLHLVFIALFAATWLVGGNVLVARHYRRRGVRRRRHLPYTSFPWRTFERREWMTLLGLAALSLGFAALALFVFGRSGYAAHASRTRTLLYRLAFPLGDAITLY